MLELLINLQLRQMCVMDIQTTHLVACYPVAIAKEPGLTPLGRFEINRVVTNPSYVSCQTGVNYGQGFLGNLALVTNKETEPGCAFAIHGTNDESLIGQEVSAGCIRVRNRDLAHLESTYLPYLKNGQVTNIGVR